MAESQNAGLIAEMQAQIEELTAENLKLRGRVTNAVHPSGTSSQSDLMTSEERLSIHRQLLEEKQGEIEGLRIIVQERNADLARLRLQLKEELLHKSEMLDMMDRTSPSKNGSGNFVFQSSNSASSGAKELTVFTLKEVVKKLEHELISVENARNEYKVRVERLEKENKELQLQVRYSTFSFNSRVASLEKELLDQSFPRVWKQHDSPGRTANVSHNSSPFSSRKKSQGNHATSPPFVV
jgi:hypothetical protein